MLMFFSFLKFNVNLLKKIFVLYDYNDFINKNNDKCVCFWYCVVILCMVLVKKDMLIKLFCIFIILCV